PRPICRLGEHVRTGGGVGRLLPVGGGGLVQRQLCARRGAAQLRLYRGRISRLDEHDHRRCAGDPLRGFLAQTSWLPPGLEMSDRTASRLEPVTAWTIVTEAPLKGLAFAREAGRILAWDEGNQLYLLN